MTLHELFTISGLILFAMFLGFLNSLLSYFLDYCFYKGSIFGGWLPLLAKINLILFKPGTYRGLKEYSSKNPHYDDKLCEEALDCFFYKVLGGCIVCTNIWLGAITFTLIWLLLPISYWLIIPYLLFSSFSLRKIS